MGLLSLAVEGNQFKECTQVKYTREKEGEIYRGREREGEREKRVNESGV